MVIAAIVAGGTGTRMGNTLPKQFLEINGKPVIIHTLERFLANTEVDHILIGIHKDWIGYMEDLLAKYVPQAGCIVTAGGADRHATVNNVIEKAKALWHVKDDTIFLTHDAVRPLVSQDIIRKNIISAALYGICGTMIPATDTIVKSADALTLSSMPDRAEMFQCQTPQSFQYGEYKAVYDTMTEEDLETATDTCKLFFLRGRTVYMVPGDRRNIKITYPLDLKIAEMILADW